MHSCNGYENGHIKQPNRMNLVFYLLYIVEYCYMFVNVQYINYQLFLCQYDELIIHNYQNQAFKCM